MSSVNHLAALDGTDVFHGAKAGPSSLHLQDTDLGSDDGAEVGSGEEVESDNASNIGEGMDPVGFAGPSEKTVKPLTPEALAAFKAAQERTGVVYISRIPPGMRPTKVRHLMGAYGEVGKVYLRQEDPKRAYLRRKYTSTKKAHYIEGWVEFKEKRVARSVAEMLNAQPIGGKKGSRWRDDVWTMKYLPKFKWNMLTEQIAHEAAVHAAQLRVELSQSRKEQREYLKNVELARVLDKRAGRKRKTSGSDETKDTENTKMRPTKIIRRHAEEEDGPDLTTKLKRRNKSVVVTETQLDDVLGSIF